MHKLTRRLTVGKPSTTLDLRYTYSQVSLEKAFVQFQFDRGKAIGTHQFQTEFYGHKDMPTEFLKVLGLTLTNCENTFAYPNDTLIVTKTQTFIS